MAQWATQLFRRLLALQSSHVLFIEVDFDSLFAAPTLPEVTLLFTFVDLMEVVGADFDDLCTSDAVSEHFALENVVQVHLLGACGPWLPLQLLIAELAARKSLMH